MGAYRLLQRFDLVLDRGADIFGAADLIGLGQKRKQLNPSTTSPLCV
jgi:hypothetical protein